jgi:hypothetical protein
MEDTDFERERVRAERERKCLRPRRALAGGEAGMGGMGMCAYGLVADLGCTKGEGVEGVTGKWTNTEEYPRFVRSNSLTEGWLAVLGVSIRLMKEPAAAGP